MDIIKKPYVNLYIKFIKHKKLYNKKDIYLNYDRYIFLYKNMFGIKGDKKISYLLSLPNLFISRVVPYNEFSSLSYEFLLFSKNYMIEMVYNELLKKNTIKKKDINNIINILKNTIDLAISDKYVTVNSFLSLLKKNLKSKKYYDNQKYKDIYQIY